MKSVFLLTACLVLTTGAEAQKSAAAQQWREVASAQDFFHEMALLQSLGKICTSDPPFSADLTRCGRNTMFFGDRRLHT